MATQNSVKTEMVATTLCIRREYGRPIGKLPCTRGHDRAITVSVPAEWGTRATMLRSMARDARPSSIYAQLGA